MTPDNIRAACPLRTQSWPMIFAGDSLHNELRESILSAVPHILCALGVTGMDR